METDSYTISMVTENYSLKLINTTNSTNSSCQPYDVVVMEWFHFSTVSLVRVLITWLLFVLSLTGNSFVIYSLKARKTHHFIMFHLCLSNLTYTLFVMPLDAVWNTTMYWSAGVWECRIFQMLKQFGMYASSFMMVVIALDRVIAILCMLTSAQQKKMGRIMVITAWSMSALCCAPAGFMFSIAELSTCEGISLHQCVDFLIVTDAHSRAAYYFFTMFISFLLPLLSNVVSYSLIVCEISNMTERDRVLMGRRNSVNSNGMKKAKRKTVWMRTLITLSFLICWGPYYVRGIYDWFQKDGHKPPDMSDTAMYIVMYLNPVLHPLVFGIFMKEIRTTFRSIMYGLRDIIKGKKRTSFTPSHSFSTSATATTNVQFNSRASCKVTFNGTNPDDPQKKKLIKQDTPL